ncbi:AAA family ATPase [Candidatus Woesearchaeota archaeon]|nr:AAA family ATPase [Candidatus Woesearchaeota archaeon]
MVSTGNKELDRQFCYEPVINCVYGKAATGKTTLCLNAATSLAKEDKKVFFIDTENSFNVDRIKQMISDNRVFDNILVMKCNSFDEQCKVVENLMLIKGMLSLVIVDSISMFYRQELQEKKDPNPRMSKQLSTLAELTRNGIPVLITAQVYSNLGDAVFPVGGSMLMNWSPCLIELKHENDKRKLILKKHPKFSQTEASFEIVNEGITLTK